MNREQINVGEEISFLDLLFNMVLFFASLFILAFLNVNIKNPKKKNVEAKAEYIITVTWPTDKPVDIDTHLQNPAGQNIWYSQKDKGLMHLDRDDRGNYDDTVNIPGMKPINYPDNREIVTIRGVIPGEYTLNLHFYSNRDYQTQTNHKNVPVKVTIEKLNPTLQLKFSKKVVMIDRGHELTVVRFTLDKDGNITETNDLQKRFVEKLSNNQGITQ